MKVVRESGFSVFKNLYSFNLIILMHTFFWLVKHVLKDCHVATYNGCIKVNNITSRLANKYVPGKMH